MVDIGSKPVVTRRAFAEGKVQVSAATVAALEGGQLPKGEPFEVARIAAIQAAKETSRLIPLCHTLNLDLVDVTIELKEDHFLIRSEVACRWATGVEMEALTAVSVAALTLYDMCKAVDGGMRITDVHLIRKEKTLSGEGCRGVNTLG
jgi:cyclic pyranopterin phosphate synthase